MKGNWGVLVAALLVSVVVSGMGTVAAHTAAQGPAGQQGLTGPQGIPGVAGLDGKTGDNGLTGATGARGAKGATGPQGPQGPAGADGSGGSSGNAISYLKSSTIADGDITLATSGSFTLIGRCFFDSGASTNVAGIFLHSSADGSLYADNSYGSSRPPYEFGGSNNEVALANAYSWLPAGIGHIDNNLNASFENFWAEAPTDDLFITGEQSALVRHANTTPTCTYAGTLQTVTN